MAPRSVAHAESDGPVGNGSLKDPHVDGEDRVDQKQGRDGYAYGGGSAGGKSSRVRKHAGTRGSTPYARPATGRHAAAGPSNAAALAAEKTEDGRLAANELARPVGQHGWWGALSNLASSAAQLVATPLTFFRSDQRLNAVHEGDEEELQSEAPNGNVQTTPNKSVDFSKLIEQSVAGVELSEEECERITQLLKSRTKGKRPVESTPALDGSAQEGPSGRGRERERSRSQQLWKPAEFQNEDRQLHRPAIANGVLGGPEGSRKHIGEFATTEKTLQEPARCSDEESPSKVALQFMNQARVPARSADLTPYSDRSFSFPTLDDGRDFDSRSIGFQARPDVGAGQYRTPAPRRGSVTSRPYTLQKRAGSVEVGEDSGSRWTPVRVPLSGGREMLKRRVSEMADGWQTDFARRTQQRGLDEAEGSVQRRSIRQAVQATPAPSSRPPTSFTPTISQPFTPGTANRVPQTARRLPLLPPSTQAPATVSRGMRASSAERSLILREGGVARSGGSQLPSLRRAEMSQTASKIFETLDMMLSPQKLVGSNLSPEVLHDMRLNERARLSQSTLDALPPVDLLRASPGRESPPALPPNESFPPSTSADYQAASMSADRASANPRAPKQKEGGKEDGRTAATPVQKEDMAVGGETRGGRVVEGGEDRTTTEASGRERGAKRGRVFRAPELGDSEEGGAAGASIFPPTGAQKNFFSPQAVATAPAATPTTSMAPVTSASGSSALFQGAATPAFTFSPPAQKESFQGLKEAVVVNPSADGQEFGFKNQADPSFSSPLATPAEKPAPSPPATTPTPAPLFSGFSGFTSKPPESVPATPNFNAAAAASKPFTFMGNASTPLPAFSGFGAGSSLIGAGFASTGAGTTLIGAGSTSGGKRKAEPDANGDENPAEKKESVNTPVTEKGTAGGDSGLLGFLKERKVGGTDGEADKGEKPPVFGTGSAAPIFGSFSPMPTAGNSGGLFAFGQSGSKPAETNAAGGGNNGGKKGEETGASTSVPAVGGAPPKLNGFAFTSPATTAPATEAQPSTAPQASTPSLPGLFSFGQPSTAAPSTSAALETPKPFVFGGAPSASTSATPPVFAFGAVKPAETAAVNPFGAPKPAEITPAITFGATKPAEPTPPTAPLFGGTGSSFSGATFGAQPGNAFGSAPTLALGTSAASTPLFGTTSATSAPATPTFSGFAFGAQASSAAAATSTPFAFTASSAPSAAPGLFAFGAQNTAAASTSAPVFPSFGAASAGGMFGVGTAPNGPLQNGPPSPGSAMDDSGMVEEPAQPAAPVFGQQLAPSPVFGFGAPANPFPAAAAPNPFPPPQPTAAAPVFGGQAAQPPANPFGGAPPGFGFNSGPATLFSAGSVGGEGQQNQRVVRKAKRPAGARKK